MPKLMTLDEIHMMIQPMKAITLWQPWASLLVCGAKGYETRSWETRYRGPIAIHASIRFPTRDMMQSCLFAGMFDALVAHGIDRAAMPVGSIIAVAELVECHKIMKYSDEESCLSKTIVSVDGFGQERYKGKLEIIRGDELLFGYWEPGRYAWEFKNMRMLDKPIPCKGKQRLWNWDGVE